MTVKQAPFAETEAGISNLDTFVALGCKLVAEGLLTPQQLVEKICLNPAKIAGIEDFYQATKGKNTPYIGQTLKGNVVGVWF